MVALIAAMMLCPTVSAEADHPIATCFRHALPGDRAAAMFTSTASFACENPRRSAGSGDFWVRSGTLPPIDTDAVIRSGSLWQDAATLYIRYADC